MTQSNENKRKIIRYLLDVGEQILLQFRMLATAFILI